MQTYERHDACALMMAKCLGLSLSNIKGEAGRGRTDLTMSEKKRPSVCLLKPCRSSMTNVLYSPQGMPSTVLITLVTRANTMETAYSFCAQFGLMRPATCSDSALHSRIKSLSHDTAADEAYVEPCHEMAPAVDCQCLWLVRTTTMAARQIAEAEVSRMCHIARGPEQSSSCQVSKLESSPAAVCLHIYTSSTTASAGSTVLRTLHVDRLFQFCQHDTYPQKPMLCSCACNMFVQRKEGSLPVHEHVADKARCTHQNGYIAPDVADDSQ
jgi:hypothetical protein